MRKSTTLSITTLAGEDDYGPWVGVPEDRQRLCAVADCPKTGRRQVCFADGRYHHHGCVHYESAMQRAGIKPRGKSWGLLCDDHYAVLKEGLRFA